MSRTKRFAHSLASGYLLLGGNVAFTLASVPLALHYLSTEEFGLWVLVTQVVGYFLLVDLGMSGSVSRVLVDHKDDKDSQVYGMMIQTGLLVLLVQAALIAVGGLVLGRWLPGWAGVTPEYARVFERLVAWQCGLVALGFLGRIFNHILQAHQRFDINNYGHLLSLGAAFIGLWLGFHWGWGLGSMVFSGALQTFVGLGFSLGMTLRLEFFPRRGQWGRPSLKIFRELFAFGSDLFLLSVGLQLNNASQILILTRTLGSEAAATWAIATKVFVLAQQFVGRIFDYSSPALAEMVVRKETGRLRLRFQNLVVLTVSVSLFTGAGIALCNSSFLQVWLKTEFAWNRWNDILLGILLVVTSFTRCHVALLGPTKQIGAMRYVYFLEGVTFVLVGSLVVPRFGFTGLIAVAIVSNLAWSGLYGVRRTAEYFHLRRREVGGSWLTRSRNYFFGMALVVALGWAATAQLPALASFASGVLLIGSMGAFLGWQLGLPAELRTELAGALRRAWGKLFSKG